MHRKFFELFCGKTLSKKTKTKLGEQLLEARHAAGLSLQEAACKASLNEDCIRALESDFAEKEINAFAFRDPAYRRLVVLRYAKVLGLSIDVIRPELPSLASLDPPGSTFLKNWNQRPNSSPYGSRRGSARFYFAPRLLVSLKRLLLLVLLLVVVFYGWNVLRHFYRVVHKKPPLEIATVRIQAIF